MKRGWVWLGILLAAAGCRTAPARTMDPPPLLAPPAGVKALGPFRRLLELDPGSPGYEKARIDYLLERISKSPYNFIRNGTSYGGARTVLHLRWKYARVYHKVKTAEDFIAVVGTRSKISGQKYRIDMGPQGIFACGQVLQNELDHLDRVLTLAREAASRGETP